MPGLRSWQVAASLAALQLEAVPVLYLHQPDTAHPLEATLERVHNGLPDVIDAWAVLPGAGTAEHHREVARLEGRVLEEYFDKWGYAPPHSLRLLGANLQIAEDRIPSLLSVIYSGKRSDALFDAVFEFEAELSLRALITQRRRWGNGSLAGLVYAVGQVT